MKFYAERKVGKKEGSTYVALYCDLGYQVMCISFDNEVICALLDYTPKQLSEIPLNEKVYVK